MKEFPDTEDKDNWSIFLFDCPKDTVERLIVLVFKRVKGIVPNGLPNYTVRYWSQNSVKISLRVLRDKKKEAVVQKLEKSTAKLLRKERATNIIVNPKGKDAQISGWSKATLRKCKAYNRLSKFVVKLAEDKLFSPNDRNEMRHLAINMLFMREAIIPYPFFVDLLSGQPVAQPSPYPINVMAAEEEMKQMRGRSWAANRKTFLYPENYLEPELRDDKSPFFEDLESELLEYEELGAWIQNQTQLRGFKTVSEYIFELIKEDKQRETKG